MFQPRAQLFPTEKKTIVSGVSPQEKLRRCNLGAGLLHLTSFIAALILVIIYSSSSLTTELRTDYRVYDANVTNSTSGPFSTQCTSLGSYSISWVIICFPIITSLFHLVIALAPDVRAQYNVWTLREGRNPLRWLEYSITASLMVWVICQLSGVTNVFLLVVLVLGNVAMQYQGYIMEVANMGRTRAQGFIWSPVTIGFILFAQQWLPIFVYFFAAITSPRPPTAEQVPWFVYTIVFGLFFQFLLFGMVMTLHYYGWPRILRSNYNNEVAYIILSFVSKFFLDWNLIIGIITNPFS